jgi:uncharacterized protein (TIGR02284 family)
MAKEHDQNLDPISREPGSHPVGTGIGAAAGGAAGAAAGALGGPAGAIAGGVAGAVAGGLGGKAVAEKLDPTAEEAYWRENYSREPYYKSGSSYDDYAPAYRMGVLGVNQYGGRFDDCEEVMAAEWASRRESSSLDWAEARMATQAAWARAGDGDRVYPGDPDPLYAADRNEIMSNEDVADVLNDLLECCRDGEYGYRQCAEHMKSADLKAVMMRHADHCAAGAAELHGLIVQMGGEPDSGGSVTGAMHRGWVSVRATLIGHSDQAMLDECERGEDTALARYRKALRRNLPEAVRAVVLDQQQGSQRNHDQIKALRDAHGATR